MSTQIKRKPLSLEEKLEISNDFNKNNLTVTKLVKKYNRPQSTVSSILKAENQEKIKNLYENNLIIPYSKKMRGYNYVKIEEALDHWFKSVLANKNITLNVFVFIHVCLCLICSSRSLLTPIKSIVKTKIYTTSLNHILSNNI
ncbi:hypothetical protein BpHYR1_006065 [Brachionus plicatilis]|uniref:Uncharacterized protein n=1 Tax=Brachionus plicatilis TaxID=10195 RepID=A0A3M7RD32_BRAPC|nr:hypothetical protein BpHYR1_006065 [Brachionus plicatilis]